MTKFKKLAMLRNWSVLIPSCELRINLVFLCVYMEAIITSFRGTPYVSGIVCALMCVLLKEARTVSRLHMSD